MGDRWKFGDDPFVKYWKYKALHKKLAVGRPRRVNPAHVFRYAREIETALKRVPKLRLDNIFDATDPVEIADVISALPHDHAGSIAKCRNCVLLGGWVHRGQSWPRVLSPDNGRSASLLLARISNRTLPELLFLAITELRSAANARLFLEHTPNQIRYIADSVAAPALYDDVTKSLKWINAPEQLREIDTSHVGTPHHCPACGETWACGAVGCTAGYELFCSGCRPSGDSSALAEELKPKVNTRYQRTICIARRHELETIVGLFERGLQKRTR